jgi:Domain of unknown function (DUF397)
MTMNVDTGYRRSSYCGSGSCVEVSPLDNGAVAVRDSKDLTLRPHMFTGDEWTAFVLGVKSGEFDFDISSRSPLT